MFAYLTFGVGWSLSSACVTVKLLDINVCVCQSVNYLIYEHAIYTKESYVYVLFSVCNTETA